MQKKLLIRINIPVRWIDMDMYRHLNNERYFGYMNEAWQAFLQSHLNDSAIEFRLQDVSCQFKKAIDFPQTVTLYQYVSYFDQQHFQLIYEFYDQHDALCALGKQYFAGFEDQHIVTIPKTLQDQFASDMDFNPPLKMVIDDNYQLLNTLTIDTRWMDVDANGHIDPTFYFMAMCEARVALANKELCLKDCLFFVINCRAKPYAPLAYPSKVIVKHHLLQQRRTSMTLFGRFFRADDENTCCAEATVTVVFIDKQRMRPCAIPEALAACFTRQ